MRESSDGKWVLIDLEKKTIKKLNELKKELRKKGLKVKDTNDVLTYLLDTFAPETKEA